MFDRPESGKKSKFLNIQITFCWNHYGQIWCFFPHLLEKIKSIVFNFFFFLNVGIIKFKKIKRKNSTYKNYSKYFFLNLNLKNSVINPIQKNRSDKK